MTDEFMGRSQWMKILNMAQSFQPFHKVQLILVLKSKYNLIYISLNKIILKGRKYHKK